VHEDIYNFRLKDTLGSPRGYSISDRQELLFGEAYRY
jgi:hypothetical protein